MGNRSNPTPADLLLGGAATHCRSCLPVGEQPGLATPHISPADLWGQRLTACAVTAQGADRRHGSKRPDSHGAYSQAVIAAVQGHTCAPYSSLCAGVFPAARPPIARSSSLLAETGPQHRGEALTEPLLTVLSIRDVARLYKLSRWVSQAAFR